MAANKIYTIENCKWFFNTSKSYLSYENKSFIWRVWFYMQIPSKTLGWLRAMAK